MDTNEVQAAIASVSSMTATATVTSPVHVVIGRRLKAIRKAQDLTLRGLAERLAELGVEWDHSRIARVERGAATFDVGELMAVAVALGVNLQDLLVPDDPHQRVQVTPTIAVGRFELLTWLAGDQEINELAVQLRGLSGRLEALRAGYTRAKWVDDMVNRNPDAIVMQQPNYHRTPTAREYHARIREFEDLETRVRRLRVIALDHLENPLLPPRLRAPLTEAVKLVPLSSAYSRSVVETTGPVTDRTD